MKTAKILDTGVHFVGARKDKGSTRTSSGVKKIATPKKSVLWPEPDWSSDAVESNDPSYVFLFMDLYEKLSKTPVHKYFKDLDVANKTYIGILETLKDCYERPSKYKSAYQYSTDQNSRLKGFTRILEEELQCSTIDLMVLSICVHASKDVPIFSFHNEQKQDLFLKMGFGKNKQISNKSNYDIGRYHWKATKVKFFTITKNGKPIRDVKNDIVYDFSEEFQAEDQLKKLMHEEWQLNNLLKDAKTLVKRPLPNVPENRITPKCSGLEFDTNRIGVNYRNGQNIDINQFMDTFKFSGIEFGNWVNQTERQDFINCTYDAYCDLMHIMGLPLHYASLNGVLGIAFGSRGVRGEMAHFDKENELIHISKTDALGSLAHEYAHAIDYTLGQEVGFGRFLSNYAKSGFSNTVIKKSFSAWDDWLESSKYLQDSKMIDSKLSKKYFATRIELFARCFEQWVQCTLIKNNCNNNFLVCGTIFKPDSKICTYPLGSESDISGEFMAEISNILRESLELYFPMVIKNK